MAETALKPWYSTPLPSGGGLVEVGVYIAASPAYPVFCMQSKYALSRFFTVIASIMIFGSAAFVARDLIKDQFSVVDFFLVFIFGGVTFRDLTTIRFVEFRPDKSIFLRSRIKSWTIETRSIESVEWKGPWGGRGEPRIEIKTANGTHAIPGVINNSSEILTRLKSGESHR